MTLGEEIRKYRKEHGLSLDQFAFKTGLSKSYLSMLENNKDPRGKPIRPSLDTIKKVAAVCGPSEALNSMLSHADFKRQDDIDDHAKFVMYCYKHATKEQQEKVLEILNVKEQWARYQEIKEFLSSET